MLTLAELRAAQARTQAMLVDVGIALTAREQELIEIAEFGLGELERTGLEIVTYINIERY